MLHRGEINMLENLYTNYDGAIEYAKYISVCTLGMIIVWFFVIKPHSRQEFIEFIKIAIFWVLYMFLCFIFSSVVYL